MALGRAIVREPQVFLFDEPLSNLDAKLRESMRVELQHLQKTQKSTTLFVTHDQIEALTMADRIGVLNQGRLVQVGTAEDIYDRPATTFVAQLVGTPRINLLPSARTNGQIYVEDSALHLPADEAGPLPERFLLGIRPEDIKPRAHGEFSGEVSLTEPLGVETIVHIRSGEQTMLSVVPGMMHVSIGDTIHFDIDRDRLHYFDKGGIRV